MLDIDHFKRINDRFGHAVGDRVLRSLCQRIGQRLRRTDVFCRGGEEFMVLCPGSDAEQARLLALELWQGVRNVPVEAGRVTASLAWRDGVRGGRRCLAVAGRCRGVCGQAGRAGPGGGESA
jgi:diguanylate cyclase (GGDEF)-like protein